MSPEQPLGGGGVAVDIATGLPRQPKSFDDRKKEEQVKQEQAVVAATNLIAELQDNHALDEVVQLFQERLMELANTDPECKAFVKIIGRWRLKVEPVMAIANLMARNALGPGLRKILRVAQTAPK